MARQTRLLIYDSDDKDALQEQLRLSLPKGVHNLAVKITIIDIPNLLSVTDLITAWNEKIVSSSSSNQPL